ncbi:hypothetical protein LAZ67_2000186 [Cordylochernes scorpioides]|uniref:Reverse transcriptase domain-containing protein n=1 Tax=Cordylochernes scorpioides TaxID=51811 RepID=A0ABY6K0L8_9ARAC|nr:hypothetical protein LAZ67_2000186 [Cordylochernes scorpioides]
MFKQIRGSPMGSPLSSPLAEIVMANIDHWVQQQIAPGIHIWRRYIDDIFCICDTGQEINILNSLNSYHPEISFTLELENRSVLPYLDILVIRTASHYHTTVYHKVNNPTFYTDYKSSCPLSHKINTVRTLTKRLFTHCSLPLFRTIEFSLIIKQLARSQYPPHFIHKYKFDPSSVRPPPITRNSCILPFSTQSVAISRILRTHGINTHFTNSNSIGAILRHPITRLPRSTVARSSGGSVYSVSCNDCSASYIGETAQLSLNAIRRFTNLNPEVIRLLTHLCRKSLQLARWRLHLNFNKICQRARFIPPSLRVADPVGNSHSNRVILRSQRQLLWARTQGCYSRIRCLSKTIKGVISQVTNLISQSNMVELLGLLTADIRQQDSIIKGRQYKKLSFWISKYGFPEEFHPDNQPVPTLLNLSSTVLSPSQTEVLSLGLKYRPPATPDIPRIISGVEPAISSLSHTAQYDIRSSIAHILRKPTPTQSQSPSQSQSLGKYRSLATLRRNHNIIITRSDKGSQTVVLDTADYASKMTEILSDRNTFVPITQPDASTSTRSFRLGLLRLKKSGHITPDQYSTFTSDLNNTPYIYGLPKTHKPGIPLRPIIAYHLSPAYKLSKYLTGILTPWVKASPQSSAIRDIPSFVQSINSLCPVPNTVMVSYDVVAMYLSLPHQLIIRHLTSFLQDNQVDHRTAESIVSLSSLCLDFTTFTFNNQLFKQIRGSPMGSPLSSPLAEIVMANIDHWVQQQIAPGIHIWRRYIDDIFCICDTGQEINILNSLNSYHPEISFTLELENRSVLPYLDILVIRTASHYHTTVYHKVNNPTFYTDYKSSCPLSHKINTVLAISRILRTHGINTHFTNSNSIGAILRHPITRLPRSTVARSSGGSVYSVSCNDCSASYIGETAFRVDWTSPRHVLLPCRGIASEQTSAQWCKLTQEKEVRYHWRPSAQEEEKVEEEGYCKST